ncbi:MAG: class I SAM-dependent methyltransferase [Steroidobacteraceae bacterium]|nr:class I SAM-dependent methyltransferase [Steroidobacteraceae bacterium]
MEPDAYVEMASTEDWHWWFRGRRAIAHEVIGGLGLPGDARILELGAGTGGNLAMLAQHGSVQAGELDDAARAMAARKANVSVVRARLPDELPFEHASFDLVCLFDVLEHVAEDVASLVAIRRLLRPTGRLLVTVPAYQWLWSPHDERLHHLRRYTRRTLRDSAVAAGFRVARLTYLNCLLFPIAVATRTLDRVSRRNGSTGTSVASPWLNEALFRVFALEARWVAHSRLPFGMSLLAVLGVE